MRNNLIIILFYLSIFGFPLVVILTFIFSLFDHTDFYQNRFIEKKAISKVLSIRDNFIFDTTYFDDEYEKTGQRDTLGNMTYIKSYVVDTSYEVIYNDLIKDKIDSFKESKKYPEYYSKIGEVEYSRIDILSNFMEKLCLVTFVVCGCLFTYFMIKR